MAADSGRSGEATSINEIVAREKADFSYVARPPNLTTMDPQLVTAILDEALPINTTMNDLAINPPLLWTEQIERLRKKRCKERYPLSL